MDLHRSIEGLLKRYDGTISFDDIVDFLDDEYSPKTIDKYLKKNKKYFEYDGETISSFQIKIDLFLAELKARIVKYQPSIDNLKNTVVHTLLLYIDKKVKTKLLKRGDIQELQEVFFFNDIEDEFNWDDEFFSTPEKQYLFTSQLFEFLLTEEFGEYGLFTTPQSIIRLIGKLLPNKNNIYLYNPTAGFLNLATALALSINAKMEIKASELNASIYEYGQLFSAINNLRADYTCTDSCDEIMDIEPATFDVILANLPFALKQPSLQIQKRKYSELSLHIITESLKKLKAKGRAFFLVNDGVLFSLTSEKLQFRKEIVDSGMLKAVISLPSKILPQSSVKTSLLVFENGNMIDNIQFIDVAESELVIINPDKTISLKTKKIASLINWDTTDESQMVNEPLVQYGQNDHKLSISIKDIKAREYDLSTGKYIAEQETYGDDYVPLKSVLTPRKISSVNEKGAVPFIRISDLNSKILDNISKVGFNTTSRKGKLLNQPSILIGTIGSSFKPTLFEGKFDVEVSDNIAIFECDTQKAIPAYLLQELNAEYVIKQMNLLSRGSAMKHISTDDLLSVRVKLPKIGEQGRLLMERVSFSNEHKLHTKEEEQTISDTEIFKIFRHEIGNILYGPEGFLKKLPGFLKSQDIDLNAPFVNGEPETVGDMVTSSSQRLQQIHWIMENMKGVLHSNKESFTPENVELKPFIEDCLRNEVTNGDLIWYVIVDGSYEGTTKYFAEIDKKQFENIIRNIVVNAIKHGKNDKPVQLVVNLMDYSEFVDEEDENVQIDFINDGNPLPANFSKNDFIKFGSKAGESKGQGLGGYLINRIVENHNGTLIIEPSGNIIEPQEGLEVDYNVHFSITIPKNQ